mmetsp:Transcript_4055/g.4611  ORF Transcript_4055/g.4611 Transcript_4055/m.4611 type:complete len:94 (+) Transcript_4055:90-371(+)
MINMKSNNILSFAVDNTAFTRGRYSQAATYKYTPEAKAKRTPILISDMSTASTRIPPNTTDNPAKKLRINACNGENPQCLVKMKKSAISCAIS